MEPNTSSKPRRWWFWEARCGCEAADCRERRSGIDGPDIKDERFEVVEATAYDELREAAMWVVLNWDGERTQHGSMPALRQALGLPSERPTREEAERRINEYLGVADA